MSQLEMLLLLVFFVINWRFGSVQERLKRIEKALGSEHMDD